MSLRLDIEKISIIETSNLNKTYKPILSLLIMTNEKQDCIFCKIVKGEISAKKLIDEDNFIAIPDANPRTPGHTLIISKKHFENILDMPATLGTELIEAIKKVSEKLLKEQKAQGFNIVMNNFKAAGQVIPHAHIHILPRKSGDGLRIIA